MRRLVLLGAAAVTIAAAALWASDRVEEGFALGPFEDLYALQDSSGRDFGFADGEQYPGHGGAGQASEIALALFDIDLPCSSARYDVVAFHGVAAGGKVSCVLADISDPAAAAKAAEALLTRFDISTGWSIRRDLRSDARRPEEWGRTARAAFDYVSAGGEGLKIENIPLVRFDHQTKSTVGVGVGTDRSGSPAHLRVFVDFRFESACWSALSAFEAVDKDPNNAQLAEYADVKKWFSGRSYSDIPTDERVAKSAQYLREGCLKGHD